MAERHPTMMEQLIAAWPLVLSILLAGIGLVEMRLTLSHVSDDLAEVKLDVATIEGMLFDRWTQDGFRDHADVAPTSVAVPISYSPMLEPRCAAQ